MSATHIKTVIVKLDGYAATGSRGGCVVEVTDIIRTEYSSLDLNGDYAVSSPLQKYVVNFEGTDTERKTFKPVL